MLAILCSAIALLHYPIDKDITELLIGLALLSSGVTDAFHTPTGIRLIDPVRGKPRPLGRGRIARSASTWEWSVSPPSRMAPLSPRSTVSNGTKPRCARPSRNPLKRLIPGFARQSHRLSEKATRHSTRQRQSLLSARRTACRDRSVRSGG